METKIISTFLTIIPTFLILKIMGIEATCWDVVMLCIAFGYLVPFANNIAGKQ